MKTLRGCTAAVMAIALLAVSCKKDKDDATPVSNPTPNNSTPSGYYFQADFDGVTKSCSNANSYYSHYTSGPFWIDPNTMQYNIEPSAGMTSITSTAEMFDVVFSNNKFSASAYNNHEDSLFHAVMKAGLHNYSNGTSKGVVIEWLDSNGDDWSTAIGSQTGSTFNATASNILPQVLGKIYHEVQFTFNCKLYKDDGSGTFKTLTNGSGLIKYEGYAN